LGAAQSALAGQTDGFVSKLNASGNALVFSTFLGGSADDKIYGLALDANFLPIVAGVTSSRNYPVAGAAQQVIGGGQDVCLTKLSASGSVIQTSTFFGGSKNESMEVGRPLAVDADGAAYIAGTTMSLNLPTMGAPYPVYRGGSSDGFIAKLNGAGTSLAFSTYIGGSAIDYGIGVTVVQGNKPFFVGYTASSNFPTVNTGGPATIAGGYDVFAVRLNAAGSQIERSEIFGGVDNDAAYGIASDSAGTLYIAGQTGSWDFPLQSAVQGTRGGSLSGFLMKIPSPGVPSVTAVSPSTGGADAQTFSLQVSDPDGFQDITEVGFMVAAASDAVAACRVRYNRALNTLELRDDTGTGWLGPATTGSGTTLENSHCVLVTSAASASGNGSVFTLNLPITFRGAFAGAKNLYGSVIDSGGSGVEWQSLGTWTVPSGGATPPALISVSPSSGTGGQQTFRFSYGSVYGYADIKWAFANITTNGSTVGACMGRYIRATNQFELAADSGSGWVGSRSVGVAGTLQNTQCIVDLGGSSASGSGGELQLNLSIAFKPAFTGSKSIWMAALNNADILAGWAQKGTWTVNVPSAPVPTLVAPSSGSGSTQTFGFTFSDSSGFSDITWAAMLIHSSLTSTSSCLIRVTRATSIIELANDAGSFGNGVAIGTGGVIQNSQCSVNASASSISGWGSSLTVNLNISFKPGFAGSKNVYMTVADTTGTVAPWTAKGTWIVP
jgi:hypothetical protein